MCEHEGCSKAFSNASDRAKHQNRTHSNEVNAPLQRPSSPLTDATRWGASPVRNPLAPHPLHRGEFPSTCITPLENVFLRPRISTVHPSPTSNPSKG